MSYLETRFGEKEWAIRSPRVLRYMNDEHVRQFFDEGRLRLSTFSAFRRNPDEQRGDPREGWVTQQVHTPNATHSIIGLEGGSAFVLCGSIIESNALAAEFGAAAGIRILHPLRFAECVSSMIPEFVGGIEGVVTYCEDLLVTGTDHQLLLPPASEAEVPIWSANYDRWVASRAWDSYFLKHSRFSHQGEYRFIWMGARTNQSFIDIVCPDAVDTCERFSVANIGERNGP